ncbi:hypothetical protein [Paracoccus rhizosphaerae]|uniref:Lipoprotein n=1 Tax=Paracoccus rhizosphaerae TaxID=1133347 RepID=A0ABV6CFB0_9RHOB|nr:hypothetical protein [Paracoccus rhizosphaerae]
MISLLALALTSACATPSPGFLSVPRQDVVVGGTRFAVFRRGNEAEVIRLDTLPRAELAAIPDRMVRAAEQATGCTPIAHSFRAVGGSNSAVARVNLRCG